MRAAKVNLLLAASNLNLRPDQLSILINTAPAERHRRQMMQRADAIDAERERRRLSRMTDMDAFVQASSPL